MKDIIKFILQNKFNLICLLIWLIFVSFTMNFHELWRDEAQAWCIVRDCSFIDALKMARIEGHPFLWYLILFVPAKIGIPVQIMQIISILFVLFSVCLVLFKSPFNKFEKIIISFSAGLIYYLPIVARNYSLIPLFLFLLAILYNKRNIHPVLFGCLIVLLSNTHLYMLGFCIIMAFFFLLENIRKILPISILVLNFLIIFCIFINVSNLNYALTPEIRMGLSLNQILLVIPKTFIYSFLPYLNFLQYNYSIISCMLFYPFLGFFFISLFKVNKKIAFISLFSILYMFFVFTKVYFNGILYQKSYLIFLMLIFAFWIIKENKTELPRYGLYSFYALFIISCIVSPIVLTEEYKFNFSSGKEIASYIKKNLRDEQIIIALGNPYLYSSISAYLPKTKFYNVITESYITYYSYKNAKNNNKSDFPENAYYSVIQENINVSDNPDLKLLYKSSENNLSSKTEREVYSVYEQIH